MIVPPSPTAQPVLPSGRKNTSFSWKVVWLVCGNQPVCVDTTSTTAVSAMVPAAAMSSAEPSPTPWTTAEPA